MSYFDGPSLTTLQGCLEELESCSRGLLYFNHLYGRVLDNIREREAVWNAAESEAASAARLEARSGATATEIKGLITAVVNNSPARRKARDEFTEALAQKEKIERWTRTLEKRMSAAQTAKGVHEQLLQGGGGS